jgi:hypothetical protein
MDMTAALDLGREALLVSLIIAARCSGARRGVVVGW